MRLIDAYKLEFDYEKSARDDNHIKVGASAVHMQEHRHILHILAKQPTIDAVPVIRCKNCKHYNLQALACTHDNFNGTIGMDGFCSYGERKKPPETEGKG